MFGTGKTTVLYFVENDGFTLGRVSQSTGAPTVADDEWGKSTFQGYRRKNCTPLGRTGK